MKIGETQYVDITSFQGLNTQDDPRFIDPSESPYMVNMELTGNGAIMTRHGYELAFEFPGSGNIHGLLPAYFASGTLNEDRLVAFVNGGDYYYVTNQNSTPQVIGTYNVGTLGWVSGIMYLDNLLFCNGQNSFARWTGTSLHTMDAAYDLPRAFAILGGGLMTGASIARPYDIIYPEAETLATNIQHKGINVGDGDVITSLVANNDRLIAFKQKSIFPGSFQFDETTTTEALSLMKEFNAYDGAYTLHTTQPALGYTYYLSHNGVQTYGPSELKIQGNLPVPLSYKIDPLIQNINFAAFDRMTSAYFQNKYYLGAAFNQETTPSGVLVYNENFKRRFQQDNWVYWTLPNLAMFCVFRDANKRDQLYFGSNSEPKVYRFNTGFSDDGAGYLRVIRTKTFRFGERSEFDFIDIEGSKPLGATVYIDINLDGLEEQGNDQNGLKITDDDFMQSGGGGTGYIGDSYHGDTYTGSAFATSEAIPMYRFKKRVRVPQTVRYGHEFWFQLRNQAATEGWKLTRLRLAFKVDADDPTYAYTD